MSISIQSVQATQTQTQTPQAVQPPKKPQTTLPQDTVTISKSAQQAQTTNTKPAASGDVDHDGDNH